MNQKIETKEKIICKILSEDEPYFEDKNLLITTGYKLIIRNGFKNTLEKMMYLENQWSELKNSKEDIKRRLKQFPEGIAIAINIRKKGKKLIEEKFRGMISSQRLDFSISEINEMGWTEATDAGRCTKHVPNGKIMDLVGLIVAQESRGQKIGTILGFTAIKIAALIPDIEYITTNARIPGFRAWKEWYEKNHQEPADINEYIFLHAESDSVQKLHMQTLGGECINGLKGQDIDEDSSGMGARISHTRMMRQFQKRLRSFRYKKKPKL